MFRGRLRSLLFFILKRFATGRQAPLPVPGTGDTAWCGKQQGNDPQMQRGMAIGCAELRYREPMGTLYK